MSDENVEREALYTLRDRWERIVASAKDGTAHVAIEVAGTYDPFACAINTLLARASRPREAAGAPEALDKALAKAAHDVWAHAHPNGVCGQDVATPYIAALGVALGYGTCYPPAPPLAPEACPVAEKPLAWTAFSESSSWTGVWCKTREGAQERVDEFKRRWPKTGPYRVVPLYATPASATAEGGVELWAQGGGRYLDGTNTMCAPIKPHSHVAYPATPAPGAAAPTEAEVEECAKEILGVLPYGATRQALEAGGAVLLARAVLAHVRKARAC